MRKIDKKSFVLLLVVAAIMIIISMFAGPLGENVIAISTAASAVIFSSAMILYGLSF